MVFAIQRKDATESTNDDVWELARQGAAEGTVVVARSQRRGRGQWGRVWVSPEGGLYFSLLLRPVAPQREWPAISPAVARALCRVVRMECGVDPDALGTEGGSAAPGCRMADSIRVKHPNDVVCDGGKICGISLEARDGCVVVGCGINVFHPGRPVETDGRNEPVYLVDLAEGRLGVFGEPYLDALLDALLDAIKSELSGIALGELV